MREIIFKGQRVDTKEWVYGDLIHNDNTHFPMTLIGSITMSKNKYTNELELDGDCLYEVIPETVGQYTDLTDKNGIRIFEGDVIRAYSDIGGYDFTAEVEWGNFIKGWYCGKYRPMYDGFNNEYEVIGNKWDNPELLEGGAE